MAAVICPSVRRHHPTLSALLAVNRREQASTALLPNCLILERTRRVWDATKALKSVREMARAEELRGVLLRTSAIGLFRAINIWRRQGHRICSSPRSGPHGP